LNLFVLFVIVDLGGLAGGAWWLWRKPGSDLRKLLVLGISLGLVAGPVALVVADSYHAILRIWCHVLFCVLAPLCIARGAQDLRRRPAFGVLLLVSGLAMEGVYTYARRVEPFDLQVRRHRIETARLDKRIRVAVLADLQTDWIGPFEREVLERLDAVRADLILFPGDFLHIGDPDLYEQERRKLVALMLDTLKHKPRLGMYAVMGDKEPSRDVVDEAGVQMLVNERVVLESGKLQIIGLGLHDRALPRRAIESFPGLTIVLAHRPNFMLPVVRHGGTMPYLCVAGHTHGGQVVVPGFGAPITFSPLPRRYAGGLHRCGEAWVLISRGVGMERHVAPRIRFLCPPELIVLEIT